MTCSGCGQSRLEASAKEAQNGYVVEPFYCHACAAVDTFREKSKENGQSAGLKLAIKKRK